jgi:hypothetical protein
MFIGQCQPGNRQGFILKGRSNIYYKLIEASLFEKLFFGPHLTSPEGEEHHTALAC